jgi:integrase/recombinase XerD
MVTVYADDIEEYRTFLTPEASYALGLYHKERQDKGEILDENSLVFVKLNGKPVDKSSTSMIIHRALVRAGLKVKNNAKGNPKKQFIRHKIQLNHGFRKRFNTILKLNNDVNDNAIEKMMGHSNGLDSTYLQITDEKLFDEFWKGVDDLTVSGEYRDKLKIRELEKSIPNKEEVINKIIPLVMDKVRKEFAVNADEVDKMNSEQLKKLVKSFLAN